MKAPEPVTPYYWCQTDAQGRVTLRGETHCPEVKKNVIFTDRPVDPTRHLVRPDGDIVERADTIEPMRAEIAVDESISVPVLTGADLRIDHQRMTATADTLNFKAVRPGRHRIKVDHPDHRVIVHEIRVVTSHEVTPTPPAFEVSGAEKR